MDINSRAFSTYYQQQRRQLTLDVHLIVSETDGKGTISYVNDNFCKVSGYSRQELIGNNHNLLKSGLHPASFYRQMWATLLKGEVWQGEICNKRKDGGLYWVKATITPFLDSNGVPYKFLSYRTEITEVKDQYQHLLMVMNSLGDGVMGIDSQGVCNFINDTGLQLLGYQHAELLGKALHPLIHHSRENGTPHAEADCQILRYLHSRSAGRFRDVYYHKSGRSIPVELSVTPWFEFDLHIGALVVFRDISELLATERQLQLSNERFRRSQISANIGTWDWNVQTGELYWSERIAPLFGLDAGECETSYQAFIKAVYPADRQNVINAIGAALEQDAPYEIEHRVCWPDGQVRWLMERGAVYRDQHGKAQTMLGTVMDIHDRKMAELALRDSEERLSVAIEGAGDGIWDWDLQSGAMQFSRVFSDMLGYLPEQLPQQAERIFKLIHPEDWPRIRSHFSDYLKGQLSRCEVEFRMQCHDGSWKWVLCRGKVVARDRNHAPLRLTGIHTDISRRKQLEQALTHAKLFAEKASQAKSDFLSSMSHELRTPLNAILGFTQLLELDAVAELSDDQRDSLSHIRESGQHLLKLINDVLELSRIECGQLDLHIQSLPLAELVDNALPMLQAMALKYQVHIDSEIAEDCYIQADPLRLKQVLINLGSNAIKYNKPGGQVQINCRRAGQQLRLSVRDTGIGISADKQQRLFAVFDRLGQEHSAIEGSGIGLVISKQIIEAMNGQIGFHSVPGEGTEFWLLLPMAQPELQTPPAAVISDSAQIDWPLSRPLQVSCVEDNPSNRDLMRHYFDSQPYLELTVFNDAESALAAMPGHPPDIVLMDIHLPGISGLEAARRMAAHPVLQQVPVIAVTAVAMPEQVEQMQQVFDAVLIKPLNFAVLKQKIGQLTQLRQQQQA